jgi:hypothetical protein
MQSFHHLDQRARITPFFRLRPLSEACPSAPAENANAETPIAVCAQQSFPPPRSHPLKQTRGPSRQASRARISSSSTICGGAVALVSFRALETLSPRKSWSPLLLSLSDTSCTTSLRYKDSGIIGWRMRIAKARQNGIPNSAPNSTMPSLARAFEFVLTFMFECIITNRRRFDTEVWANSVRVMATFAYFWKCLL